MLKVSWPKLEGLDLDIKCIYIYPTPPHKQNMTQGQFFMWSLTSFNSVFLLLDQLPYQVYRAQYALAINNS